MSWRGLWTRLRKPAPDEQRWVVLDVETSGLDPGHDELLCVAALGMQRLSGCWTLRVQDSFEQVLRPRRLAASADNVLLHGLGWGAQSRGANPGQTLEALRAWVGHSPVLAFHADFDRRFLEQACRRANLPPLGWHWLDLADVLPVVYAQPATQSLDQWMTKLNVQCPRRHEAAADVWATAQLWLKASQALPGHEHMRWRDWRARARQVRWMATDRAV